ncbi:MAG: sigma-70 family RNA polymerase sigma factor [Verrucomicrobiae bacterium]|nr:sigma-70 family RNA polymerase sigma factor [Verrucomicrobiae bacterium]
MDEVEEQDLIQKATSGDLSAFDVLIRAHEGGVRAFFRVRLFDWSTADDLAQDVFVTAFKRISTFRRDSRFSVWLRGIATNHLRNHLRKRRDVPVGGGAELQRVVSDRINLQYDDQFSGREAELEEQVLLESLMACLTKLDDKSRMLLQRRYMEQRSVRDIAIETSKGYSALTMQLHRIRESLAECIRRKISRDQ